MKETVAAVVVTYNRKDILLNCLNALLRQTRPLDRIFVIDNASTDGTPELLDSMGLLSHPVIEYVRLVENIGGAGGFHEGTKLAYESGYQWVWLMDDDGCPEEKCLEKLLNCIYKFKIKVIGPMVIDITDEENFRFVPTNNEGKQYLKYKCKEIKDKFPEFFPYGVSIFHGLLISSTVIKEIGFPKKEMFIWGDEYDYLYRMKKNYVCGTCTSATFKHPLPNIKYAKCWIFGHIPLLNDDRLYYLIRNMVYINKKYFPKAKAVEFAVRQLAKYLIFSLKIKNLSKFQLIAKAIIHGFKEKWDKV